MRPDDASLDGVAPIDVGDGTDRLPGEMVIRIMLADLDHLDDLPPEAGEWLDVTDRRRALFDDFRRLREVIG